MLALRAKVVILMMKKVPEHEFYIVPKSEMDDLVKAVEDYFKPEIAEDVRLRLLGAPVLPGLE